jgi:hypothetical protein
LADRPVIEISGGICREYSVTLGASQARGTFSPPDSLSYPFRHGWLGRCRRGVPEDHRDAITDHRSGSVGRSYGRGMPLRVLAESTTAGYAIERSRSGDGVGSAK